MGWKIGYRPKGQSSVWPDFPWDRWDGVGYPKRKQNDMNLINGIDVHTTEGRCNMIAKYFVDTGAPCDMFSYLSKIQRSAERVKIEPGKRCTDVKDSNGDIIYEGDKLLVEIDKDSLPGIVTWRPGAFIVEFLNGGLEASLYNIFRSEGKFTVVKDADDT